MEYIAAFFAALWQAIKPYLPEIKGGATGWMLNDWLTKRTELKAVEKANAAVGSVDSMSRAEQLQYLEHRKRVRRAESDH